MFPLSSQGNGVFLWISLHIEHHHVFHTTTWSCQILSQFCYTLHIKLFFLCFLGRDLVAWIDMDVSKVTVRKDSGDRCHYGQLDPALKVHRQEELDQVECWDKKKHPFCLERFRQRKARVIMLNKK